MLTGTEGPARRGIALLLAIITASLVAIAALALWHVSAGATRHSALEQRTPEVQARADDVLVRALARMDAGAWRVLDAPLRSIVVISGSEDGAEWSGEVGRTGWSTLVVRARAEQRTGVPMVRALAERRALVPLVAPLHLPDAALTGGQDWIVDPSAVIDVPPAVSTERACRSGRPLAPVRRAPWPAGRSAWALTPIDPDTVRDSLVGAFRLTRQNISAMPLTVTGMLVTDTDLLVGADLRVTGVLIAGGSIRTAGGRLDVAGAVVAGDSSGGQSRLGAGDRVRYDACAIRGALLPLTSPGPASSWTTLRPF